MRKFIKGQAVAYLGCMFTYLRQTEDGKCLLQNIKTLDYREQEVPCKKVSVFIQHTRRRNA